MTTQFCSIPPVNRIINSQEGQKAVAQYGHAAMVDAVRAVLNDERTLVRQGQAARKAHQLATLSHQRLEADNRSSMQPVYNLTGTVLHTNLGRAQLADIAVEASQKAMQHAVALEYDINSGTRGERDDHLRRLICQLTGAEDATLVNNNAAAVMLTLNTLAGNGRDAILSRGEMIEIGAAFRMPDIMAAAGAKLCEIGTTNRTHADDYRNALSDNTGLILKVHTSNYRIEGFTKNITTHELAQIAHAAQTTFVEDLGSGILIDIPIPGLKREPIVRDVIRAGADIVTFSGDKLLGGPQAGFIVGRAKLIEAINNNPLKRALRVDKIRLAALEATLRLYSNQDTLLQTLPTLRFLCRTAQDIEAMAQTLVKPVQHCIGTDFMVQKLRCHSQVGSGAMPTQIIESAGLAITCKHLKTHSIEWLAQKMRHLPMPVIGRIEKNNLILDLRCLEDTACFIKNMEQFQQ